MGGVRLWKQDNCRRSHHGTDVQELGAGAALLALAGAGAPAADGTLEAQIQSPSGQLVYAVYEGQGEGGNTAADSLRAALAPGSSAILALVDMGRMDAVTALLEPTGPRVLGVTVVGATAPPASAEGQSIARAHRR